MSTFDALSGLAIAIYGLLALALVVLLIPLRLAKSAGSIEAFFGVPFITWYLLHYTVATLGILGVVILGLVGVLNATAIAALLGGLFGYVLGATSRPHDAATVSGPVAGRVGEASAETDAAAASETK